MKIRTMGQFLALPVYQNNRIRFLSLASHGGLAQFGVRPDFCLVAQILNTNRETWLVITITFVQVLREWPCLARSVIFVACRVHSWLRLLIALLRSTIDQWDFMKLNRFVFTAKDSGDEAASRMG